MHFFLQNHLKLVSEPSVPMNSCQLWLKHVWDVEHRWYEVAMLHLNTLAVVCYVNCAIWLPVDTILPIHNTKIMWGRWHCRWNANYPATIIAHPHLSARQRLGSRDRHCVRRTVLRYNGIEYSFYVWVKQTNHCRNVCTYALLLIVFSV